ncbi:MAG: hypothetical protein ACJ762_04650 [Solirubrobacteraceae bacterium]
MLLAGPALLLVAMVGLGAAGWRAAGRMTSAPLERALAAAPLAACAAALEALALGRVGLGAEPLALTGAALATALVAHLALPVPIGPPLRWTTGAVIAAGVTVALVDWLLRTPALGVDGISYHLPEVLSWIHGNDTGATPLVVAEFQTGSYPLTNEVLLTWQMGIARSFAPVATWTGLMLGLLALGGWVGLRRTGTSRGLVVLALAALLASPVLVAQLNTPKTDLPALAWLVACAGLCACAAGGRTALLGPALAAAGLSVGTKTTTAPLALIVLAATLWTCRGALRPARVPLAWGTGLALAVGGVWYLRNVIAHGWFFWPFGSGPFGGDPEPVYLSRIHVSVLDRPRFTLEDRAGDYLRIVGGGIALIAGGIAAAVLARRSRLVLGAAAATAIALLAWLAAPFTGRASDPILDLSLTTTRYLLPVLAAGAAALALAGRTSRLARAILVLALAWSLVRSLQLDVPDAPPVWVLLAGAAGGAVFAVMRGRAAWTLAAIAAVIGCAMATDGWLGRSAQATKFDTAPLEAWFAAQPGWADRREPVAFVSNVVAPVAGDRLRHPVSLIPGDESCDRTLRRTVEGYVALRDAPRQFRDLLAPVRAPECLAGLTPVAHPGVWMVYRQTATTSSAASRSSSPSRKSPTPIAASSGV